MCNDLIETNLCDLMGTIFMSKVIWRATVVVKEHLLNIQFFSLCKILLCLMNVASSAFMSPRMSTKVFYFIGCGEWAATMAAKCVLEKSSTEMLLQRVKRIFQIFCFHIAISARICSIWFSTLTFFPNVICHDLI